MTFFLYFNMFSDPIVHNYDIHKYQDIITYSDELVYVSR